MGALSLVLGIFFYSLGIKRITSLLGFRGSCLRIFFQRILRDIVVNNRFRAWLSLI